MNTNKIIVEISEILMLDEDFNIYETKIEFDSLSSLMLVEFLDSNFEISITKDEIKNFKVLNDIIVYIQKNKS
jgi:acyl carrier protein